MATELKRLTETILIPGTIKVVVTEIASQDGRFIRAFKFFGAEGTSYPPALEVRTDGATPESIQVTTPEIQF